MELTIPFHIRGNDGTVHVEYLINEDPRRWGNTLVASAAAAAALYAEEIGRGFPLCRASVTYAGEGYAAVMAWTQILHFSGASNGVLVDQPPQLEGSGMPYMYGESGCTGGRVTGA
jgi:hypothetical protein